MLSYLGQRLRAARQEAGLSQGDIARACGVSQPAISYWERPGDAEHYNEIDLESLIVVARVTGKPVGWFLNEREPELAPALPRTGITVEAVAAEADHYHDLAIRLGDSPREPSTVDSFRLHLALGVATPYAAWLKHARDALPFVAGEDYWLIPVGGVAQVFWSMAAAQALALLEGTARGFAIWRALMRLEIPYRPQASVARIEPPAAPPPAPEPPPLRVSPREYVEIVSACFKHAHQAGLAGERAVRAADRAAEQLTGWSPVRVLGVEVT